MKKLMAMMQEKVFLLRFFYIPLVLDECLDACGMALWLPNQLQVLL